MKKAKRKPSSYKPQPNIMAKVFTLTDTIIDVSIAHHDAAYIIIRDGEDAICTSLNEYQIDQLIASLEWAKGQLK